MASQCPLGKTFYFCSLRLSGQVDVLAGVCLYVVYDRYNLRRKFYRLDVKNDPIPYLRPSYLVYESREEAERRTGVYLKTKTQETNT